MMQFPNPIRHTPMPRYPDPSASPISAADHARFIARDSKVRMHNLARHVAAKYSAPERIEYLAQMARVHKPAFMVRFKRLVGWYWRAQRRDLKPNRTRAN